jgi:hypothetical protein
MYYRYNATTQSMVPDHSTPVLHTHARTYPPKRTYTHTTHVHVHMRVRARTYSISKRLVMIRVFLRTTIKLFETRSGKKRLIKNLQISRKIYVSNLYHITTSMMWTFVIKSDGTKQARLVGRGDLMLPYIDFDPYAVY